MKITVITPSFNQGRFIERCIDSVRKQANDVSVEHIILDNCSTDFTAQALDDYRRAPGRVDLTTIIEPDAGQTSAINKGLALATGDIVCWLNTDEEYEIGTLKKIATYFESHSEVDVAFGDCDFIDESGRLIKRKREHFFSKSMLVNYGCYISSCGTFLRRRIIDDGILLDPSFKVTMDFDWYVRIANAGYRFAHLPLTLARFTWHDSNISTKLAKRRREERQLVQVRHGGMQGPRWWRLFSHGAMRTLWIGIRVITRAVNR